MEIFNIGPLELIIILLLMFVLLGPKEMIRTANRVGRWIRSFVRSPMWKEIMGYSQEIRELPQKIMEESGLQETLTEVRQTTQAAADELNSQIKEVTEAARVPEIEHLKLDTTGLAGANTIMPETQAAQPVPFQAEPTTTDAAPSQAAPLQAEAVSSETVETPVSDETADSSNIPAAVEAEVASATEAISIETPAVSETPVSSETAVSPETADSEAAEAEETPGAYKETGVSVGIPVFGYPTVKKTEVEESKPAQEQGEAVVPTNLQPVESSGEPAAILSVAVDQPAADTLPAEPVPAPRRRRTKTTQPEGETPKPAQVRRKKAGTNGAASADQPPAALEPVNTPVEDASTLASTPLDEARPENGKSGNHADAAPETPAVRKPRARRSAKTYDAPDTGAQPNAEQVRPSDAA